MRNFKQMVVLFLVACVSLQTQASTLPNLSKNELEQRTRGGILKQRLSDRQIRVLCEDDVMIDMESCQDYAFYLVQKAPKKSYSLHLIGTDLAILDWESVQKKMDEATSYYYPRHQSKDIILWTLALFFPPLIIPVAIIAATNEISRDIHNARILNFNERLTRFQHQSVKAKGKTLHLNKKKFEMALIAFQQILGPR